MTNLGVGSDDSFTQNDREQGLSAIYQLYGEAEFGFLRSMTTQAVATGMTALLSGKELRKIKDLDGRIEDRCATDLFEGGHPDQEVFRIRF